MAFALQLLANHGAGGLGDQAGQLGLQAAQRLLAILLDLGAGFHLHPLDIRAGGGDQLLLLHAGALGGLGQDGLGFAAGLCAAFSVGNLGAVALLAGEGQATLPLLMARLMGAYRTDAGAAVGLVTLGLAFALFAACDAWGRRDG